MMKPIDVTAAIGAVTREVKAIERDARPAYAIVATRVFETGVADLWDAITTPDRIARWLLPVEGELRLGGRYQLEGHAGGTITACEPPRHFAVTWESGGKLSWVEVRLEAAGPRTRLVIEHSAHPDDLWEQFGPGAGGVGWDLMLLGLFLHLATGGSVTEQGMAWAASDEGKRFQQLASDDWCRASIAAGTDPSAARAAADRTIAAYTASA